MNQRLVILLLAVAALLATSCVDASQQPVTSDLVPDVRAVSLAPGSDGSLLWAERASGRIMRWVDGTTAEVATVEVSTEGQRGLLGVAEVDGRVYAAWSDPDERMTVAEVAPDRRVVWDGFDTKKGANGGRLLATADGQLLFGVGTLLNSSLVPDSTTINGKLLLLDPLGSPDQAPVVVSGGWNNPFAFAYAGSRLWVADNHPSEGEERLTWGLVESEAEGESTTPPVTAPPVTVLPADSAPTGLASIDGRLYVCGYNSRSLYRYNTNASGRAVRAGTVADDCRYDVVALGDRLVYAAADAIRVIDNVG